MDTETDHDEHPAEVSQWEWIRNVADDRKLVLGILFFVTAASGLPLLWFSRSFSLTAKIILSILVSIYTVILIYACYHIVIWSYARVIDTL